MDEYWRRSGGWFHVITISLPTIIIVTIILNGNFFLNYFSLENVKAIYSRKMVSSKWHSTLNIIFSNRFIKINSFIFYSCYRMRSFKKKSFLFCNTETKTSKAWQFCGLQPYETKPILTILTAIIIQHNEIPKITTKQNVLVLVWLLPRSEKKNKSSHRSLYPTDKQETNI